MDLNNILHFGIILMKKADLPI